MISLLSSLLDGVDSGSDPRDLTAQYNTQLSPEEERAFQAWAGDKLKDTYDYDLRGAWKDIVSGKIQQDERGHLPDTYKKPNHPTFSNESIYSTPETPGGKWVEKNYKWQYVPSETNLKYRTPSELMDYFKTREPDVRLVIPKKAKK